MERYVDGDMEAFGQLHAMIRPPIAASLRRWLRSDDRVDDAVQATLLKLHTGRSLYRKGAPLLPWVLTIARNVALDRLRSAHREPLLASTEADDLPSESSTAAEWSAAEEAEVLTAVRDAVEQLPPATRDVIRMHKLEEKTMAEVAAILGIRPGAARVRAHRGYRALARILSPFRSERS